MRLTPVTRDTARAFVAAHHRHNMPPKSWLFGVGLTNGSEELVGVAMAGRPLARPLQDGATVEVLRVCTLGDRNANSRLYGAVCRAAAALGYRRAITYTLASESGSSLRAAGFRAVADVPAGRTWATPTRPRYSHTIWGVPILPPEDRTRWERRL